MPTLHDVHDLNMGEKLFMVVWNKALWNAWYDTAAAWRSSAACRGGVKGTHTRLAKVYPGPLALVSLSVLVLPPTSHKRGEIMPELKAELTDKHQQKMWTLMR